MEQSEKYEQIENTVKSILSSAGNDLLHYGGVLKEQLQNCDFKEKFEIRKESIIHDTTLIIGLNAVSPTDLSSKQLKNQMSTLLESIIKIRD